MKGMSFAKGQSHTTADMVTDKCIAHLLRPQQQALASQSQQKDS
jgi:hypothetical protein